MKKGLLASAAVAMALTLGAPLAVSAEPVSPGDMIIIEPSEGNGGIYSGMTAETVDEKWGTSIVKTYGKDYEVVYVGDAHLANNTGTVAPKKTVKASDLKAGAEIVVHKGKRIQMGPSIILTADDLSPVIALAKAEQIPVSNEGVDMYRMYNPNSGEHHYTAETKERDQLVKYGWKYEGVGWTAPKKSNTPVYRLYNKTGGEHHYTTDAKEKNALVNKYHWTYEGIGWYSDDAKTVTLYREYNPNQYSCNHNYTPDKVEHNVLVSIGWRDEGIAWYGIGGRKK